MVNLRVLITDILLLARGPVNWWYNEGLGIVQTRIAIRTIRSDVTPLLSSLFFR